MIIGKAFIINERQEKILGPDILMSHYPGKHFVYKDEKLDKMAMIKIESLTGKKSTWNGALTLIQFLAQSVMDSLKFRRTYIARFPFEIRHLMTAINHQFPDKPAILNLL